MDARSALRNLNTYVQSVRLRALARRQSTAQPRILKAADVELDPLRRTVARGRQRSELWSSCLKRLWAPRPPPSAPQILSNEPGTIYRPFHEDRSGRSRPLLGNSASPR